MRKGSSKLHNSCRSFSSLNLFSFFCFTLCADKAFFSRCFPPVASWIALPLGQHPFSCPRFLVLTAFVIPAVLVPKEISPTVTLLSWHNEMHVTSYHVMNGLFMQPQTLCLTLSFCTSTCQWQEVNKRTIFFAFVPSWVFPLRAWMMIPFILCAVVAPKWANKVKGELLLWSVW